MPEQYTKEELLEPRMKGITVGELKAYIEKYNIPDDAPILVQRVEDEYFELRGWKVYTKKQSFENAEYHPVWSYVYYEEDKDILFLDLHY